MKSTVPRPKDPRHSAGLTGGKPLRYDRHGDTIPPDDDEHDPLGLVGGRWLAQSFRMEVRR